MPGGLTRDRAGQLGRLRAWAAERREPLVRLLEGGWTLYAEWLWLEHGVHYDRLPDWLVVIDLWHPEHGFDPAEARDRRGRAAGVALPPRLFEGVLGSPQRALDLIGQSAYSSDSRAEGLILRAPGGGRCKVVAAGHVRRSDEEWMSQRRHNQVTVGLATHVGSGGGLT